MNTKYHNPIIFWRRCSYCCEPSIAWLTYWISWRTGWGFKSRHHGIGFCSAHRNLIDERAKEHERERPEIYALISGKRKKVKRAA